MGKGDTLDARELWRNVQACTPRALKGDQKFNVQRDMVLYWLLVHQVHSHKLDLPRMAKDKAAVKRFAAPLACVAQVFLEEEMKRHQKLYECYERLANEALRRLNLVFNGDHRFVAYRAWVKATAYRWLVVRDES